MVNTTGEMKVISLTLLAGARLLSPKAPPLDTWLLGKWGRTPRRGVSMGQAAKVSGGNGPQATTNMGEYVIYYRHDCKDASPQVRQTRKLRWWDPQITRMTTITLDTTAAKLGPIGLS